MDFGPWLRASTGGWRVRQQGSKKDVGEEGRKGDSQHRNFTKVIHSKALLAKLVVLTVNEASSSKEGKIMKKSAMGNRKALATAKRC